MIVIPRYQHINGDAANGRRKKKKKPLSEAETDLAFSGPAYAANRALIFTGAPGVRISFVEQYGPDKAEFRTAVLMPYQDVIGLKNTLIRLLADAEKVIA